ncbi:hypothetical protein R1sor_010032 [Riccia sorocarpa]|uniref:Uncharacterized protein n=1 Tax=Riccia sorocarpa TaxID=122646 RepID=A0ABD3HY95_9MARC
MGPAQKDSTSQNVDKGPDRQERMRSDMHMDGRNLDGDEGIDFLPLLIPDPDKATVGASTGPGSARPLDRTIRDPNGSTDQRFTAGRSLQAPRAQNGGRPGRIIPVSGGNILDDSPRRKSDAAGTDRVGEGEFTPARNTSKGSPGRKPKTDDRTTSNPYNKLLEVEEDQNLEAEQEFLEASRPRTPCVADSQGQEDETGQEEEMGELEESQGLDTIKEDPNTGDRENGPISPALQLPVNLADVMDEDPQRISKKKPPQGESGTPDRGNAQKKRAKETKIPSYQKVDTFSQLLPDAGCMEEDQGDAGGSSNTGERSRAARSLSCCGPAVG